MEDGYNIQEESISRESSDDRTCLVVWRKMSTLFDRRKMIGLGLILVTVVLWVTFAQVSNYLLVSQDFDKPFFITYLQNSLLAIFLLKIGLFWVWKKFVAWMRKDGGGGVSQTDFVRVDASNTSLLAEGETEVPVYKGNLVKSLRLFYRFTRAISASDCSFTCIHICTNIYGVGILQVGFYPLPSSLMINHLSRIVMLVFRTHQSGTNSTKRAYLTFAVVVVGIILCSSNNVIFQSSVVFTFLISVVVLNETVNLAKVIAVSSIIGGIVLVSFSPSLSLSLSLYLSHCSTLTSM